VTSKKDTRRKLKKEFEQTREEYAALQKKWERGQAKTEKRATKLRKLAAEIAHLEGALHDQHLEAGKSLKEKRAEKHAKADASNKIEIVPPGKKH